MAWRTTESAEVDLGEIERYGTTTYGRLAAELYVDDLFAALDLLAINPRMVRERSELGEGLRLYRFRAHYVLYRIDDEDILVVRVIGARQDLQDNL